MTIESLIARLISDRSAASRRALLSGLMLAPLVPLSLTTAANSAAARKSHKKQRRRRTDHAASPPPPSSPPPPPPDPVVRADAACAGPDSLFGAATGNTRIAQTFTPAASGLLVSAQFSVDKASGTNGDYVVSVNQVDKSGFPTNKVLAQTVVANLSIPDDVSTVDFTFSSPAAIAAGTLYALVLSRPGGDFFAVQSRRGGCAGQAFFSADQSAPFTLGDNDGDLIFTTFVSS